MKIARVGNQNTGKTTLFNALTGGRLITGNFPGVTVELAYGTVRAQPQHTVCDLPGLYSLWPFSGEERIARDALLYSSFDAVINVVDAGHLERNLYLTLQLLELELPMVVALNLMDDAERQGTPVRADALQAALGVPVVPVCARTGEGEEALLSALHTAPARPFAYRGPAGKIFAQLCAALAQCPCGLPAGYAASRAMEGDPRVLALFHERAQLRTAWEEMRRAMQKAGLFEEDAVISMRYAAIEDLCRRAVSVQPAAQKKRPLADAVLLHRVLGLPIFLCVLLGVFYITFGLAGGPATTALQRLLAQGAQLCGQALSAMGAPAWLQGLICGGIFPGLLAVLGFFPIVLTLYFFLALLEDSGYLARVSVLTDALLRRFGLSGGAFFPMLLGLGCTVPAILATRTLPDVQERGRCIFALPFLTCGARLPIAAAFTAALFPQHRAAVLLGIYVLGVCAALFGALLAQKSSAKTPAPMLMELPPYRIPGLGQVCKKMWAHSLEFFRRAFTTLLLCAMALWALQSCTLADGRTLLLAAGGWLAPVFAPLGFADARAAAALLAGLFAKENVLSALAIALNTAPPAGLSSLFTPAQALSFLAFAMLYAPCVAAFTAARRELGSFPRAFCHAVVQTGLAYAAAFFVYTAARLCGLF